MAPIQEAYQASKDWQDITLKAYPPPEKKQKKVKDKGSRHPGNKPVVPVPVPAPAQVDGEKPAEQK